MRVRAVLIVAGLAARARADDIRDQFGLGKQPAATPPVHCADTHTLGCVWAEDELDAQAPYALATWLPASYLWTLPVADATHDQLAGFALGGTRDETGPVFGSGNGLENRWTLDGAPIDSAQLGGADTRIPLAFLGGMTVTAGGFAARDRASLGGTIDAQLVRGTAKHEVTVRAFGALPLGDAAHRADARATYQVRTLLAEPPRTLSGSIVATGPIAHDVWYAAGIAYQRSTTSVTSTASRLVDADGDGVPDLDGQGRFVLDPIEQGERRYAATTANAMARAGYDGGPHHVELTLLGTLVEDTRLTALATAAGSGIDRATYIGDAIATYRGTWTDTRVKLQAGWHRSQQRQTAPDTAQTLSAYVPGSLPDDPALAAACVDDPKSMFIHCPVPLGFFASGGAGLLVDTTADRPSISADLTHRLGRHVLRLGATGEDTRLVLTSRFTGGEQIRSLFPGHTDELRFIGADCGAAPTDLCAYQDRQTLSYRTRYTAAYAEDTFTPVPGLRVDGGLRWELMWVGTQLHFSNELAPRLGIAWDVLRDGHVKAWASFGKSFAMLPAGLGQTILQRNATVADTTVANVGSGRSIDRGAAILVAPGIQPVAQDEAVIGVDAGLAKVVQLTLWGQARWLERGLDTTPTGFDNPGARDGAPAERSSAILAVQLATTGNPALRVGYQYGRAWGNWTGAYDPRQGAVLYAGDAFDSGSVNLNGRLPSDQGHRVYIEGAHAGHLFGWPVRTSLRLTLGSGRPRDVVALTSGGDYQLLPRGEAGHGPMLSQANLHVETPVSVGHLTLDVFNLFDRTDATNLDQVYTRDSVMPISGGAAADLIWLRDASGAPAVRSRTYGLGTAFQAPVSATLGARFTF